MATRYYSATALDTTITSGITLSSTTVAVGSTTGFPSSGNSFVLALDYNTAAEELVLVTSYTGLTLTISRANAGLGANTVGAAVAHAAGAVVRHVITAQDMTDAQNHYNATTLVHGIADTANLTTNDSAAAGAFLTMGA